MRAILTFVAFTSLLQAQGSVEGKVVDSVTHSGIAGITVSLSSLEGSRYEAKTDGTGVFSVSGVREGSYRAVFVLDNYNTNADSLRRPVQVVANQATRVTFELARWAALSGHVLDAEGNPLAGAKIFLRDRMGQTQASVASARDGSFGLGKLVAGSYTLSARPTAQAQRRSEDKLEVVETYFPNAIEEELALKIGLQAGATADGYNIRLQRVPVFSVRGMVRGADGQPAPDTRVMIGKRRSPASMPGSLGDLHSFLPGAERLNSDADDIESVMTAADGGFAFPSVREGDWMLQAESEWIRVGETDVQQVGYGTGLVSRRDVDGIELRLSKSFGLNAKVELMDEAKAPPNTFASLLLRPSGPGSYSFGTQDGEFGTMKFAQVVAGRYVVTPGTLGALNGLHLAAVYLGGVNVTGQPVDLTESSPPLRAVFKKGVGTIRGMLTGGPATILAIPRNSAEDPTIFSMEATPGVEFRIPGLAPGSYAVGAFDRVEGAGIFDQGTIQRLSTLSSAVKVEEDGVASVELHVNAWPE